MARRHKLTPTAPKNQRGRTMHLPKSLVSVPDALGAGQARMTNKTDLSGSRFRKRYRELTPGELALNDAIKDAAAILEALIEISGTSRYNSIALTELETSIMYAIKHVTGAPSQINDATLLKLIRKAKRSKAD